MQESTNVPSEKEKAEGQREMVFEHLHIRGRRYWHLVRFNRQLQGLKDFFFFFILKWLRQGFLNGSDGKEPDCSARDSGLIAQSLGWEDPLEKEMATHSSILAWRILWTEEPAGLQSMGSQRVRHDNA